MKEPRTETCLFCHGSGYLEKIRLGRRGKVTLYKERCKNCHGGIITASELHAQLLVKQGSA